MGTARHSENQEGAHGHTRVRVKRFSSRHHQDNTVCGVTRFDRAQQEESSSVYEAIMQEE